MEPKSAGRPGIDKQTYISQIQTWLNACRLDEITATMLQKAVGGNYKKAVTILDEFKSGYETKELAELPEPPEQLTNALNSAALEAWRILWEAKTKEVADMQAVFDQEKAKLEALSDERLDRIDELENELSAAMEQIAAADLARDEMRDRYNNTREQLASETATGLALKDKLSDREQQLADSKQEKTTADQLLVATQQQHEAALSDLRQAHNEELADIKSQQTESLRLHEAAIAELQAKYADQLGAIQTKLDQAEDCQQQLSGELSEQTKRAEKAETQLDDAKTKVIDTNELRHQEGKKAAEDITNWQQRHDSVVTELADTKANLAAANAVKSQTEQQNQQVQERADRLETQLIKLAEGKAKK